MEGTEVAFNFVENAEMIVQGITVFLGLFKVFPLNIFLTAGLGFLGIGFVNALKHTGKKA